MAKEFSRTRRVGEQIQRELAELIRRELKDPRLGMVTISAVEVSRDLSVAKVFFTLFNPEQAAQTLEGLNSACGFLRRELGRRMMLRIVPELKFEYDHSIDYGSHMSKLINEAMAKENKQSED